MSRPGAWAVAVGLALALGCTGTATRDFTRESYEPPADGSENARVFEVSRERLWATVLAVLARRGAQLEVQEDTGTRAIAKLLWASPEEASASVALGRIRTVATRTTRTYRSWSPLDFRCNACVVRNGTVIDQQTQLLGERSVPLDPAAYRIEVRVSARVEPVRSGTRLVLGLDFEVEPWEPNGLLPVSTGFLESSLLDEVSAALAGDAPLEGARLR